MAETYQSDAPTPVLTGDVPLAKPQAVTTAVRLFYASAALSLIFLFLRSLSAQPAGSAAASPPVGAVIASTLVGAVIGFGILYLLLKQLEKGKNWVRILFAVFVVLGVLGAVLTMGATFTASPLAGILTLVQLVVQAVAVYLLFTPAASAWFKSVH